MSLKAHRSNAQRKGPRVADLDTSYKPHGGVGWAEVSITTIVARFNGTRTIRFAEINNPRF
jgi:hypothetical protein